MILVDTSIWIDHLRKADPRLSELLRAEEVLIHPFVVGELALGSLRQREAVLASLQELPQASVPSEDEVLHFILQNEISGSGIGYVDAHLLAATFLDRASLWTRDKRLQGAIERLGLSPRLH